MLLCIGLISNYVKLARGSGPGPWLCSKRFCVKYIFRECPISTPRTRPKFSSYSFNFHFSRSFTFWSLRQCMVHSGPTESMEIFGTLHKADFLPRAVHRWANWSREISFQQYWMLNSPLWSTEIYGVCRSRDFGEWRWEQPEVPSQTWSILTHKNKKSWMRRCGATGTFSLWVFEKLILGDIVWGWRTPKKIIRATED